MVAMKMWDKKSGQTVQKLNSTFIAHPISGLLCGCVCVKAGSYSIAQPGFISAKGGRSACPSLLRWLRHQKDNMLIVAITSGRLYSTAWPSVCFDLDGNVKCCVLLWMFSVCALWEELLMHDMEVIA